MSFALSEWHGVGFFPPRMCLGRRRGARSPGDWDTPATGSISRYIRLFQQVTGRDHMDPQASTSQAEAGEVHDYNYPIVNHCNASTSRYKGNSEHANKSVTQEITLSGIYQSGMTSTYSLAETDSTGSDGYLAPNITPGSLTEDPCRDHHSYHYPDPVVEYVHTNN